MKSFLNKPKLAIPVIGLIAIATTAYFYPKIGTTPVVDSSISIKEITKSPTGSNTTLAFPKSGRVETVLVKTGDKVVKGQVLARLSAPDSQGTVDQTAAALKLAEAQYSSLNSQYATTKKQQDILVTNAHNTLLSSGLEGVPSVQDKNVPVISGTYTCEKEGAYKLKVFTSMDNDSGHSIEYSGLESGTMSLKYDNPVALGNCGLQIRFNRNPNSSFDTFTTWTIDIPNTKSASYLANKNSYNLAITNRDKILSDLQATIGQGDNSSVAKAQIEAARGAYEAALGAYQTNLIVAPFDGIVSFIDKDLKDGQSVTGNKTVISITAN